MAHFAGLPQARVMQASLLINSTCLDVGNARQARQVGDAGPRNQRRDLLTCYRDGAQHDGQLAIHGALGLFLRRCNAYLINCWLTKSASQSQERTKDLSQAHLAPRAAFHGGCMKEQALTVWHLASAALFATHESLYPCSEARRVRALMASTGW